jgi:hypothetical protein
MKRLFMMIILVGNLTGQTPDGLLREGRAFLASQNYSSAINRFTLLINKQPGNEEARFLRAAATLFFVTEHADVVEILDKLSVSKSGRDIFNWRAELVEDESGLPAIDPSYSSRSIVSVVSQIVLNDFESAISDIQMVTNRSFRIKISKDENKVCDIVIDFADTRMILAGLYFCKSASILLSDWHNDGGVWGDFRSIIATNDWSLESILLKFPTLLTDSTNIKRADSKAALIRSCEYYLEGSELIRGRIDGLAYLFTFDSTDRSAESRFYNTVTAVYSSLEKPAQLPYAGSDRIYLAPLFEDKYLIRDLLPLISSNSILIGSWPDLSFGNIVSPKSESDIVLGLKRVSRLFNDEHINPIRFQTKLSVSYGPGGPVYVFGSVLGLVHGFEWSTNLVTWDSVVFPGKNKFFMMGQQSEIGPFVSVPERPQLDGTFLWKGNFYVRLVDAARRVVCYGIVCDKRTQRPIPGAKVIFIGHGKTISGLSDSDGFYCLDWGCDYSQDLAGQFIVDAVGYLRWSEYCHVLASGAVNIDVYISRYE